MCKEDLPIGFYFRRINQAIEKIVNRKSKSMDLTKSQCDLLSYLYKNRNQKIIQRDIEHYFHISNPTVTGILNRLSQKGYIERVKSEDDRRVHYIQITQKTNDLCSCFLTQKEMIDKMLTQGLDNQEKIVLKDLLSRVLDNLITIEKEDLYD